MDSAASLPMSAVDLREDCLNPKCRERSLTVTLTLMVVKEMWPDDDDTQLLLGSERSSKDGHSHTEQC